MNVSSSTQIPDSQMSLVSGPDSQVTKTENDVRTQAQEQESGKESEEKHETFLRLRQSDESRLGALQADSDSFCDFVKQGRGANVCLLLLLDKVLFEEGSPSSLKVETKQLRPTQNRVPSVQCELTLFFNELLAGELRDFLWQHHQKMTDKQPLRCLLSGYGARISRKYDACILFEKGAIVCKMWSQEVHHPLFNSDLAGRSDEEEEGLWYERIVNLPERSEPTDAFLTATPEATPDLDSYFSRLNSPEIQSEEETKMPTTGTATAPSIETNSGPIVNEQSVHLWPRNNGSEQAKAIASDSTHDIGEIPTDKAVESQRIDDQRFHLSSNMQRISPDQPSTPKAMPPSSFSDSWFDTPRYRSNEGLQEGRTGEIDDSTRRPAADTSETSLNIPDQQGRNDHPEERHLPVPQTSHNLDQAPESLLLLAEAEAGGWQHSLEGPPNVTGPFRPGSSERPHSASTPMARHVDLANRRIHDSPCSVIAVVHSCQEARKGHSWSSPWSVHVALLDRTGPLRTMIFAPRQDELAEIEQGAVVLFEFLSVNPYEAQQDSRQGLVDLKESKMAILAPPKSAQVRSKNPEAPKIWANARLGKEQESDLVNLWRWYHFEQGAEWAARVHGSCLTRPLKRVCDIDGTRQSEYFDMLATVLEFYAPQGPKQPATVYVTDYTWHPRTRASYDQHLGYEESEYMRRTQSGSPGGGFVLSIALWERQIVALAGLQKGQHVLWTGLRAKSTPEYGISASVGSASDNNLKVRDAGGNLLLPKLLERQAVWQSARDAELNERRRAEDQDEEVWAAVHEQPAVNPQSHLGPSDLYQISRPLPRLDTRSQGSDADPTTALGAPNSNVRRHERRAASETDELSFSPNQYPTEARLPEENGTHNLPPSVPQGQASCVYPTNGVGLLDQSSMTDAQTTLKRKELAEDHSELAGSASDTLSDSSRVRAATMESRPVFEIAIDADLDKKLSYQQSNLLSGLVDQRGILQGLYLLAAMPADPQEWIRASADGIRLHLALLLARRGHGTADDGVIYPEDCLPVIVTGEAAQRFFNLDGKRLANAATDMSAQERLIAEMQARIDDLTALSDATEIEAPLTWQDVLHAGQHDWGVCFWQGKKTGKVQASIYGCHVRRIELAT